MRHRKIRTKLSRTSAHRQALMSNLLIGLVEHGRIRTTERKAQELRRVSERVMTKATRLGDLLLKTSGALTVDEQARVIHAMRIVRRKIKSPKSVVRLFREWAPRFLGRPGGYTRLQKVGFRRGDGAPLAVLEFVDANKSSLAAAASIPAQSAQAK